VLWYIIPFHKFIARTAVIVKIINKLNRKKQSLLFRHTDYRFTLADTLSEVTHSTIKYKLLEVHYFSASKGHTHDYR